MQIFSQEDELYPLQEVWNTLDTEKAITYSHYDLARETDYTADQWKVFLSDGRVAKYLDAEVELFKQAQMRKLISRATTNDKSVGTAQMLNAIGKSMEDEQTETNFFIYSYVPLTANETHAPTVRQENDWRPPTNIIETDDSATILAQQIQEEHSTINVQEVAEPSKEVEEDEYF